MYKVKVSYILPEGEQVRVVVCAVKEDGSQIFQMEIPVAERKRQITRCLRAGRDRAVHRDCQ